MTTNLRHGPVDSQPQKLIVHAGVHKTATTSLQNFLRNNVSLLRERGTKYIPLDRMRSDVTPLISHMGLRERQALTRLFSAFDKPTVLLSDENILGAAGDVPSGDLYPFAGNRILRFCEVFSESSVEIYVTLRRPSIFLAAMYSEFLRHNPFVTFDRYTLHFNIEKFSYSAIFSWVDELQENAKIVFTPFESELGGGLTRVADGLISAACGPNHGIDIEHLLTSRSRPSFTVEEIELAAEVADRTDGRTAKFFLAMLESCDRRFGSRRFDPLSSDLAAELDRAYERDMNLLRSIQSEKR